MTDQDAALMFARLARYCRARTDGPRSSKWRDRATLCEASAWDIRREQAEQQDRERRARLSWPERVRELLEGRRPEHGNGCDPFGHRRPRTLEPARVRIVQRRS